MSDINSLSDEDLIALDKGDYNSLSDEGLLMLSQLQPKQEPTIVDKLKGAGEAALNVGTAFTSGMFGGAIGAGQGIIDTIRNGSFGTQEGVNQAEKKFSEGMDMMTYSPKTELGKEYSQPINEFIATHGPSLAGVAPQLEALSVLRKPAQHQLGEILSKKETPVDIPKPETTPTPKQITPELQADIESRINTLTREINIKQEKHDALPSEGEHAELFDDQRNSLKEDLDNLNEQRDKLLTTLFPEEFKLDSYEKQPEQLSMPTEEIPLSVYQDENGNAISRNDFHAAQRMEEVAARFDKQMEDMKSWSDERLSESLQKRLDRYNQIQEWYANLSTSLDPNAMRIRDGIRRTLDRMEKEIGIQQDLMESRGIDYSAITAGGKDKLLTTELGLKMDSGDVRGTLDIIANKSPDSALRRIAERLKSNPHIAKFLRFTIDPALKGLAAYKDGGLFFKSFDDTTGINTIHEILHSATSGVLDAYRQGKDLATHFVEPVKNIVQLHTDLATKFRDKLDSLMGEYKKEDGTTGRLVDLVLHNEKELVAYGQSHPIVREALSRLKVEGKTTALQKLMNSIAKMWGGGKELESALSILEKNTNDLIDSATPESMKGSVGPDFTNSDIGYKGSDNSFVDALKSIPVDIAKYGFTAQSVQFFKSNPIIQAVSGITKRADRRASSNFQEVFGGFADQATYDKSTKFGFKLSKINTGEGLGAAILKSSYTELANVLDVFRQGYEHTLTYEDTLAQFGQHLNENEVTSFRGIAKAADTMLNIANQSLVSRGLRGINPTSGYFPLHRIGSEYVSISVQGVPVRLESFISKAEAERFVTKFSKENPQAEVTHVNSQEMRGNDSILDILESVKNSLLQSEESRTPEQIAKIVNDRIEQIGVNSNSVGGHNLNRTGLTGFAGSELYMSAHERGKRFASALETWAKEYTDSIRRREIQHDSLVYRYSDTGSKLYESMPNAGELADFIVDAHTNKIESVTKELDSGIKNSIDSFALTLNDGIRAVSGGWLGKDNLRFNTHVIDRASGIMSHLFYAGTLTMRPSIWISQYASTLNSFRSFFKEDGNVIKAMGTVAETLIGLSTGSFKNDADFMAGVRYMSQHTDVFHPQLTNELNKLAVHRDPQAMANKILRVLSGETMSAHGDTYSRFVTWTLFYKHLYKDGYRGRDLWERAGDIADMNQFQYGKKYQPAMYQKMGMAGEMMSPLKTFAHGQLGNLIVDIKDVMQNPTQAKNHMALAMNGLNLLILGGMISAPLVAEYEAIRLLGIKLGWWGESWPSWTKKMLEMPTWMSHGVLSSTTGIDIGASLRYNSLIQGIVDGNQSALSIFPAISFSAGIAGAVTKKLGETFTGKLTPAEDYSTAKTIVPRGPMWGMVDDAKFNAKNRKFVPKVEHETGEAALVPQTQTERTASYLGSQSVNESRTKAFNREEQVQEQVRTSNKQRAIGLIMSRDPNKIETGAKMLMQEGIPPDQIKAMLVTSGYKESTPLLERFFTNRKGNVTSYDQARKLKEVYPFIKHED